MGRSPKEKAAAEVTNEPEVQEETTTVTEKAPESKKPAKNAKKPDDTGVLLVNPRGRTVGVPDTEVDRLIAEGYKKA